MTSISIVIVNWNAADVLPACLRSIEAQSGIEIAEVIVVDNASSDASLDVVRKLADLVGYHLDVIANADNRGFGAANNQGAKEATGDVLVLLNPDTELLGDDALATLARELDSPGVGLAGPHLLNTDGTTQGSCAAFPSIHHSVVMATGLHRLLPVAMLRRVAPEEWSQDASTDTDWLRGACLAFRRSEYISRGGFSEATFMYGEDLEIAFETRAAGLVVRYCHESSVIHHDDHSANKRWNTPERMTKVGRGALKFLERHYSWPRRTTIRLIDLTGYAARWLVHAVRRDERASTYRALTTTYLRSPW